VLLDGSTELIDLRGMQDCFRAHPEMYGSELEDDEEEVEEELRAREQASVSEKTSTDSEPAPIQAAPKTSQEPSRVGTEVNTVEPKENKEPYRESANTTSPEATKSGDEGGDLVPKSAHDAS
jgi:intermembrane space import and assembly protein 40